MLNNITTFVNKHVAPNNITSKSIDIYGDFTIKFLNPTPNSFFSADIEQPEIKFFGTDFHEYIKSINDMELNINGKLLEMPGITYALHRLMPMNPKNSISMEWLNTKYPFIEGVFVPWMRTNTIEGTFPIRKCDLQIEFPKLLSLTISNNNSKNIQYWYYGVRPIEVKLHKMTNQPLTEFYRSITFDFDYFLVKTNADNNLY